MNKKNTTYNPCPANLDNIELPTTLEELIEQIAENVHDVWAKSRIDEGWTFGNERNDEKKTHPCLVPYNQLPEIEKDYDRNTAINSIKLVIKLGYRIIPKE